MARYYKSRLGRPISNYQPLPLDLIANKVNEKQGKLDYARGLTQGNLIAPYSEFSGDDVLMQAEQKKFNEQMKEVNNMLAKDDIDGATQKALEIRSQYPGMDAINFNNGQVGGSSTSKIKSSGSSGGTTDLSAHGSQGAFGSRQYIASDTEKKYREFAETASKNSDNYNQYAFYGDSDRAFDNYKKNEGANNPNNRFYIQQTTVVDPTQETFKAMGAINQDGSIDEFESAKFFGVKSAKFITEAKIETATNAYMDARPEFSRQWSDEFGARTAATFRETTYAANIDPSDEIGIQEVQNLAINNLYRNFDNILEGQFKDELGDAIYNLSDKEYKQKFNAFKKGKTFDDYMKDNPLIAGNKVTEQEMTNIRNLAKEQFIYNKKDAIVQATKNTYKQYIPSMTKKVNPDYKYGLDKKLEEWKMNMQKDETSTVKANAANLSSKTQEQLKTQIDESDAIVSAATSAKNTSVNNLFESMGMSIEGVDALDVLGITYVSDLKKEFEKTVLQTGSSWVKVTSDGEMGLADDWLTAYNIVNKDNPIDKDNAQEVADKEIELSTAIASVNEDMLNLNAAQSTKALLEFEYDGMMDYANEGLAEEFKNGINGYDAYVERMNRWADKPLNEDELMRDFYEYQIGDYHIPNKGADMTYQEYKAFRIKAHNNPNIISYEEFISDKRFDKKRKKYIEKNPYVSQGKQVVYKQDGNNSFAKFDDEYQGSYNVTAFMDNVYNSKTNQSIAQTLRDADYKFDNSDKPITTNKTEFISGGRNVILVTYNQEGKKPVTVSIDVNDERNNTGHGGRNISVDYINAYVDDITRANTSSASTDYLSGNGINNLILSGERGGVLGTNDRYVALGGTQISGYRGAIEGMQAEDGVLALGNDLILDKVGDTYVLYQHKNGVNYKVGNTWARTFDDVQLQVGAYYYAEHATGFTRKNYYTGTVSDEVLYQR